MQNFWRQLGWTLGLSALLVVVLSVLGILMTPNWHVEPLAEHLRVEARSTAIHAKGLQTAQEGAYKVKETQVKIKVSDSKSVNAIVREPVGAPNGHPACVFLHGSGTGKSTEAYGDLAHAMASAGITTLVQDKRLDNYQWNNRDYNTGAHDYEAGLNTLRSWPGVDKRKAGLYAESEGTWIATIMARQDKHIAFAVLTSPPVFSGRQMMAMSATEYLEIIGAPYGVQNVIPKVTSLNFDSLGLGYADFDAADYRKDLSMPLLVNYGTHDPSMPVEQGAQTILTDTHAIGNDNVTLRYYPTNHQMRVGSSLSLPNLQLEEHYTHDLEDWVNAVALGTGADGWATPMIAGDQPFQEYAVPTAMKPGIIHSVNQIFALCALAVLFWLATVIGGIAILVRNGARTHKNRFSPLPIDDAYDTYISSSKATQEKHIKYRFRPLTRTLLVLDMVLAPIMVGCFLWYCWYTAQAALQLKDCSTALNIGWGLLRVASFLMVLLLVWSFLRVVNGLGTIQFDHDEPKRHLHLANGHWFVLVMECCCMLTGMILAEFFGLLQL